MKAETKYKRWTPLRLSLWAAAAVLILLFISGVIFIRSAAFQASIQRRVIAAMEKATGARVELQQFVLDPMALRATFHGLTVHGRERAGEPPLFTAELVEMSWRLLSIWGLRTDFRSLRIWNPHVYLAIYDDGSNNLPAPVESSRDSNWPAQLLNLRVQRLQTLRGELQLQARGQSKILPLDLHVEQFHLDMSYEARSPRYSGKVEFQRALLAGSDGGRLATNGVLQFGLYSQKLEIESLELRTAGSHVSAHGLLEDFRSPHLQFHYDGSVNWSEVAEFFGRSGWKGETAWQGDGSYTERGWQFQGSLSTRASSVGLPLHPVSVSWNGTASVNLVQTHNPTGTADSGSWRAQVENINVSTLGGRLTGKGLIAIAPAPASRFELTADHISVAALARVLVGARAQVAQIATQLAGSVSGPIQAAFSGAHFVNANIDCTVEPSLVIPAGFQPVSGALRGGYRAARGRFDIQDSSLNMADARITANGWVDQGDSALALGIEAQKFDRFFDVLNQLWKSPAMLPVSPRGPVKASVQWTGGTASPRISGNVQLSDFEYGNLQWNSFAGHVDLQMPSSQSVSSSQPRRRAVPGLPAAVTLLKIDNGKLLHDASAIDFNASLELTNSQITPQSPFSVAASLRDFNLQDLEKLAAVWFPATAPLPAKGILRGSFQVSGTRGTPSGKGTLELNTAELYGERFDKVTAQVALDPSGSLAFRQFHLQKGRGSIQGDLSIGLHDKQYRLSLLASNIATADLQMLRTRVPEAILSAKLTGEGNLNRPAGQGQLDLTNLHVGGREDGHISVTLNARDGQAQLAATGSVLDAPIKGSGTVQLQRPFPFTTQITFADFDPFSLISEGRKFSESLQITTDGTVRVQGELDDLQTTRAAGEVSSLKGAAGPVAFRNAQPVQFAYANGLLSLERLHLVANNTDLEAAGTISVARQQTMNIGIKGHLDLAAFDAMAPDLSTSGQASLDAALSGSWQHPVWRGRVRVADAALRYGMLPNGLSKINGTLVFDGNRATLENFAGESGGGSITFGGALSYFESTGLAMQLNSDVSNVRIRYPEGISTWIGGRVTLNGSSRGSTLAGKLIITKQTASPEFDIGSVLTSRKDQPLARVKSRALQNLRLDVQIVSAPNVSLETTTAKNLRGDVDLRIQGSLDHPSWLGRISILQGEVTIGGRRYLADRGELTFSNPFRIEPTLNLQVRARVEQTDIRLSFAGPLDRLTVTYSSDPPLPTSEILALLVAGSSYAASLQPAVPGTTSQVGATSFLSQALSEQMSNRLDRIFGAGHIRVDPQIAGFGRPANANVALEQHIKDNLTLLYVTNVTSAQQRIIQAELTLSPRFSVTAIRDQNGLVGVNFQISLRFR